MTRLVLATVAVLICLAVTGWDNTPRAGAGGIPDLIFPFPEGQTWSIGPKGYACGMPDNTCHPDPYADALDFTRPNANGAAVRAAAAGTLGYYYYDDTLGWFAVVNHASGYSTKYAHLQALSGFLPDGTSVAQGQTIGYTGCSGNCATPHIHFELRQNGVGVKPEPICGYTGFLPGQSVTSCIPDADGDGVRDSSDNCPDVPEDIDLFDDQDGCAEPGPDEGLRADFNGDGRADVAHICCGNFIYTWFSNADGTYYIAYFSPGEAYDVHAGSWRVADANGDGKTDLIHLCCLNYMHTWFSNGDGTYSITYFSPGAYDMQAGSWRVGDANGDGKSDLIHLCCLNYMHTWFSNGDGTYSITYFSPGAYDMQAGSWRVGDANGDGKSDLIHLCCSNYIHTWFSNGDGSFNVTLFQPGAYNVQVGSVYVADANGDGKSDVIHLCCSNYIHTWFSNGDGTYNVTLFDPPGTYNVLIGSWKTAEVNGDGKSDLINLCCAPNIRTWRSNGDGSYNLTTFTPGASYSSVQFGSWQVADADGDGRSDLIHRCCPNYIYTSFSNGGVSYNILQFVPPGGAYGAQLGSWLTGDFAGDRDGDSFLDGGDNCPAIRNTLQEDADGDEKGDACDVAGTGDVDCNSLINSVDALKILRHSAGLSVTQTEPCLDLGQVRLVPPPDNWLMGDVSCSGLANSVDALLVLRASAGLSVNIPVGCPDIKPE